MKLWKAFTNSMINLLSVLDNFTEGTNELSLMYKDACKSARQEQEIEAKNDLNELIGASNLTEDEIAKLRPIQ